MKIYYGAETKKALKNFNFSFPKTKMEMIISMVKIKRSAAIANFKSGTLNEIVKNAIVKSCDDILLGRYDGQFPLSGLQGGAGTATNMNVNEVIASLSSLYINNKTKIHPNDDVNKSQSTNDVNPSALKISALLLLESLEKELFLLVQSLLKKSKEFKNIKKLGRTHLQDAVPTTLGKEFDSYAFNLKRHLIEIKRGQKLCLVLNLGGTAIGNSINANNIYIKEIYKELNKLIGRKFIKAENMMAKTSGQVDFLMISQIITALVVDLSKMANDLRFMSSGPRGGIGEISIKELQKGSSIMPGKVNPVMPELINQLYYLVSGNNLTIEKAVEGAQMELGVMLPITAERLIESIKTTSEAVSQLNNLCIKEIKANKEKCNYYLENSMAYATLLVPRLGYDLVSLIVKKAISSGKSLREIVVYEGYMNESDFNKIVSVLR